MRVTDLLFSLNRKSLGTIKKKKMYTKRRPMRFGVEGAWRLSQAGFYSKSEWE